MKDDKLKSKNNLEIHPSRRRIFTFSLIFLPILFFILLELFLWIIEYGNLPPIVNKKVFAGREYYVMNRSVAARYFTQKGTAIPEVSDDMFEVIKRPDTRRIFMLGESTMAGFPFDYNATAPRLLQDRLRNSFPNLNIEVVNVGIAAINSYTVLDLIAELVNYEPDAFIVYLGHNEFYGAYGIGSTEYLGKWRSFINYYIKLQRWRTFVLIRNGINSLLGLFKQPPIPRNTSLMETMVREKTIAYESDEYKIARENFCNNLHDIISIAKNNKMPIVISTLTSNIRDQKPFLSIFNPHLNEQEQQKCKDLMNQGLDLIKKDKFDEAIEVFNKVRQIDSTYADLYFYRAKCFDTLHLYEEAYKSYILARDYDALRFRATKDFNQLIRDVARIENIPVADAEYAFENASTHQLVGKNLMLEHLHPNYNGYFLLAKVFFETLHSNYLLVDSSAWKNIHPITDEELHKLSGVTEFTLETANIKIHSLVNRWPFKQTDDKPTNFTPITYAQKIALDYINKSLPWSSSHMRMAEWYESRKEYEKALNEYYAISKVAWYSYQPYMKMGDMARLLKRPQIAESLYQKAIDLDSNPFVYVRLGMLYHDMDSIAKSIEYFEKGLRAEENARERFKREDLSLAYYFLAISYGKSGNITKAKKYLELAIKTDPSNNEAKALLDKLR